MVVEDFKHLSPEIKKIGEQIDTDKSKSIDTHELKDDSLKLLKDNLDKKDISKLDGLESSIKGFLNANNDKQEKKADVEKALIVWNKLYNHTNTLYNHTNTPKPAIETSTNTTHDTKADIYTISQFGLKAPEGCVVDMHAKTDGTDFTLSIPGSESTINFSPKVGGGYELKKDPKNSDTKNIVQYIDKDNKIQHGEVNFDGKTIDIKKLDAPAFTIGTMTSLKDFSITSDTLKFEPIKPDGEKFFRVQVPVELPVGRLGGDRKYTETLYADKDGFLLSDQTLTIYDKREKENPLRKLILDVSQKGKDTAKNNNNVRGKMNYSEITITKPNAVRKDAKIGTQHIEDKQKNMVKDGVSKTTDTVSDATKVGNIGGNVAQTTDTKTIDTNISKVSAHVETGERGLQAIPGLADYFIRGQQIVKVKDGKLTPELDLLLSKSTEKKSDKKTTDQGSSGSEKSLETPTKAYVVIGGKTFENTLSGDGKQILTPFDDKKMKETQEYIDFNKSMESSKNSLADNFKITIDMASRQPVTKEDSTDTNITNILTPMYQITQYGITKPLLSQDDLKRVHLFTDIDKKTGKEVPLFLNFLKDGKTTNEKQKDQSSTNKETVNRRKVDNGPEMYLKQISLSVEGQPTISVENKGYTAAKNENGKKEILGGTSLTIGGSSYFIDDQLILRDKQGGTELEQIAVTEQGKTSYLTYDKDKNSFVKALSPDSSLKQSIEKKLLDDKIAKLTIDMPKGLIQKDIRNEDFSISKSNNIIKDQSYPYDPSKDIDLQKEGGNLLGREVVLDAKNQIIKSYLYTVGDKIIALSTAQHKVFKDAPGDKVLKTDGSFDTKIKTEPTISENDVPDDKKLEFDTNKNALTALNTKKNNASLLKNDVDAKKWLKEEYSKKLKILNDEKSLLLKGTPIDKEYTIDNNGNLSGNSLVTKTIDNKDVRGIQTQEGFRYLENKVWKIEKDGKVVEQGNKEGKKIEKSNGISPKKEIILTTDEKQNQQEIKSGFKNTITFSGRATPNIAEKDGKYKIDNVTPRDRKTGKLLSQESDQTITYDPTNKEFIPPSGYELIAYPTDKDKKILVKQEISQDNTSSTSSENGKEKIEKLPDFKWIGYYKKDPSEIIFKAQDGTGDSDVHINYTKAESKKDQSQSFKETLQIIKEYSGSNVAINTLKNDISGKESGEIIRTVQEWSKKQGCNCKDFDNRRFGLKDELLGINTYSALLTVIERECRKSKEKNIINDQSEKFFTVIGRI